MLVGADDCAATPLLTAIGHILSFQPQTSLGWTWVMSVLERQLASLIDVMA
jgi:hypothetical protein